MFLLRASMTRAWKRIAWLRKPPLKKGSVRARVGMEGSGSVEVQTWVGREGKSVLGSDTGFGSGGEGTATPKSEVGPPPPACKLYRLLGAQKATVTQV